jgi:acetoin utilization deacetylase AcuC-like enzyme
MCADIMLCYSNVKKALREFKPSVLVYNAGTDILEGDPLGLLSISPYVSYLLFLTLIVGSVSTKYCIN